MLKRLVSAALLTVLLVGGGFATSPVYAQNNSTLFSETFDPVKFDPANPPEQTAQTSDTPASDPEEAEVVQRVVNEGSSTATPPVAAESPAPVEPPPATAEAVDSSSSELSTTAAPDAPVPVAAPAPQDTPSAAPPVKKIAPEPESKIGLSAEDILAQPNPEPPVEIVPEPQEPVTPVDRALVFSVRDLAAAVAYWQNTLGIGPWKVSDVEAMYPEGAKLRIARTSMGSTRLELIQALALDEKTAFYSRLDSQGLIAFTPSTSTDVKLLAQRYQPIIKSKVGVLLGSWDELGVNLWIPGEDPEFWGTSELPAEPVVKLADATATRIGIVVPDARKFANFWLDILGIQPWSLINLTAANLSNAQFLGFNLNAPAATQIKMAVADTPTLQIQLLQPAGGASPYQDFLYREPLGLHHWSLGALENFDQVVADLEQAGIGVQMKADIGGEGRSSAYLDFRTNLGFVLELSRPQKGESSLRPYAIYPSPYQ